MLFYSFSLYCFDDSYIKKVVGVFIFGSATTTYFTVQCFKDEPCHVMNCIMCGAVAFSFFVPSVIYIFGKKVTQSERTGKSTLIFENPKKRVLKKPEMYETGGSYRYGD